MAFPWFQIGSASQKMPSVYSACVVTVGCPGLFIDVRPGLETAANGATATVYAVPVNIGGTWRTVGPGVQILSPRPSSFSLDSITFGHEPPSSRIDSTEPRDVA
jgi:hypothetical protein